jgi:hypothetical protein
MIESLEAVPEGSGTMLDNSIVVWASGISESTSHNNHSVPLVIAGSGGGYLKQGVKFQWGDYGLSGDISERYDSFGGRHNNDLLVSLCNAMGHPVDSFGAQEYNQGPLDEIEA